MTHREDDLRRVYWREKEQLNETVRIALCEAYQRITGKKPSDRLSEALFEAVEYEAL